MERQSISKPCDAIKTIMKKRKNKDRGRNPPNHLKMKRQSKSRRKRKANMMSWSIVTGATWPASVLDIDSLIL
jgi:hypothetical protein